MSIRKTLLLCCGVALSGVGARAGTVTGPVQFGTDATSGVSSSAQYTHLLDFIADGAPATINGVTFTAAGSSGANFSSTNIPGAIDEASANNGGVTVSNVVTAGSGSAKLLSDFYYNANANPPRGQAETLTLTGLTPGKTYQTRVYYRAWAPTDDRTTLVTFDEGTGAPKSISVNQDGDPTHADYLQYDFTAGASGQLVMTYAEAAAAAAPFASWHNYGVTNALVPEPGTLGLAAGGLLLLARRRR